MSKNHTRQWHRPLLSATRRLANGFIRLLSLQQENQKSRQTQRLLKQVALRLYQSLMRPIPDSFTPQARRKNPYQSYGPTPGQYAGRSGSGQ